MQRPVVTSDGQRGRAVNDITHNDYKMADRKTRLFILGHVKVATLENQQEIRG